MYQGGRCHCGPFFRSLLLLPSGFALCEAEGFFDGDDDGRRWGRRNANASEASTTRSDFRMQAQAAASDCVTVETCRECGVPVPVLPVNNPQVHKCVEDPLPLSEATDDRGTGLWWQLVWTPSNPPSCFPHFPPTTSHPDHLKGG